MRCTAQPSDGSAKRARHGWATTPVTELGFVRVSSNRRALPTSTTPAVAAQLLARLTALEGHRFLPDTVRGIVGDELDIRTLTGHRQVTDAHLLALALATGGPLVTFDRAIAGLAAEADVVSLRVP